MPVIRYNSVRMFPFLPGRLTLFNRGSEIEEDRKNCNMGTGRRGADSDFPADTKESGRPAGADARPIRRVADRRAIPPRGGRNGL